MLALLFPGQGSQSVGMGRDVHQESPEARAVFAAADAALGFGLRPAPGSGLVIFGGVMALATLLGAAVTVGARIDPDTLELRPEAGDTTPAEWTASSADAA